jgi:hypothetical protein
MKKILEENVLTDMPDSPFNTSCRFFCLGWGGGGHAEKTAEKRCLDSNGVYTWLLSKLGDVLTVARWLMTIPRSLQWSRNALRAI